MRVRMLMAGLLALAMPALAGPTVAKGIMRDVPPEALGAAAPIEEQLATLETELAEAEVLADEAKGSIKTEKLEAKAAEARLEADKAATKAARKSGDRSSVREAKATADETRAAIEQEEAEARAARAARALASERVSLLKAEIALRESELELVKAQAAYDAGLPIDVAVFDAAVAKSEIQFQQARTDYSLAEAKHNAKTSGMAEE
jgi:hypothetical protein